MHETESRPHTDVANKFLHELSRQNFVYHDPVRDAWKRIVHVKPPQLTSSHIQIKLKGTSGPILTLPYPLAIPKLTAYTYGLGLGAAYWARGLRFRIQQHQVEQLKDFARSIGSPLKVYPYLRGRKAYGKGRHRQYFREYRVRFPRIILKLFNAIAGTSHPFYRVPKIPSYLPHPIQKAIVSGYLNSKRAYVIFQNKAAFSARCTITVRSERHRNHHEPAKEFLQQVQDMLQHYGIKSFLAGYRVNARGITIYRIQAYAQSTLRIQKVFRVTQIKFLALHSLFFHRHQGSVLSRLFSFYEFTELDIILLGYMQHLAQEIDDPVIEYSRFEEVFDYSSAEIHKALYELQGWGFLVGFMNERHKEFYRLSTRYLHRTLTTIQQRLTTLERRTGVLFKCSDCSELVDYLAALTDAHEFQCTNPRCGSLQLKPAGDCQHILSSLKAQESVVHSALQACEVAP